ncbi:MAG: 7-cyano-7-deazaguanine synthase QueC [Candidatus Thermoplasmatota archaeon]|nr:7-cyano-7-deazaguanine synthase QueC [Candidatus Thermoplasmatota archaeon]
MRAVVLLSGGLDSSTTIAIAKEMGYELHALTIFYGQRHEREIISAKNVAADIGVNEHRIFALPDGMFSGSSLTGDGDVPKDRKVLDPGDIPSTYVPARNLVFLSIALSWAEAIDADAVFIGATAVDYSGYPDCRPEFISSFAVTGELATKRGMEGRPIKIVAPLLDLSKAQIIMKGVELGLDHSLTWSCYEGGKRPCGRCDSCILRKKGFEEAGLEDPVEYEGDVE